MKKQWWHDKVAYQIYPKSFQDSNNDGVGDLRGIINRLDYLEDLGVEIVWISPMYKSPFVDQGYDIADYYSVDPIFGTMEDMEELIKKAKKRGISILLDLVINHCSFEHEWFKKALADPSGEYGDYFYIKEGNGNNPPNNWRSYFGGSAWEKIEGTNKYYLHMFAKEQPDLNFENPIVREKIYEMMNWWLEKGIAGYRVDAIINIKKDLTFQSYPADRDDGLASPQVMLENATGVLEVLKDISKNTFEKHRALSIAELFDYDPAKLEDYIGQDGCFSTIFEFDTTLIGRTRKGWYDYKKPTANEYKQTIFNVQKNVGDIGFVCNIIENHDEPRGVSHYLADTNDTSKKMLATIMMLSKGMPFIYQGQEIGMENNEFESIDDIDDIFTIDEYKTALLAGQTPKQALQSVSRFSRDNTRTPMQWNDKENSGFTGGTPWLKLNKKYRSINVEQQLDDKNSILNFYKQLISLRKNPDFKETFVYGEFQPTFEDVNNVMAFYRKTASQTILVVANNQNKKVEVDFPLEINNVLINNLEDIEIKQEKLYLNEYQAVVLDIKV